MSQAASFGVPSGPPATPTQMAFRINASVAALLSMNSGATAPAYAVKGTLWLDTSATPHPVKLSGGAGWATLGTLDPETSVFEFNIDSELEIADITGLVAALAAKVPASRTVSGGGLATGGGNLASNVTITVPPASQAQAEEGTDDETVMTPLRTAQAIAALAAAPLPTMQVFTASGTWTRPAGCRRIKVTVTGGGGGGGGADNASAVGRGGGAGATAISLIDVTALASAAVVVGAAGTAGSSSGGDAGHGGSSSFNSTTVVAGGGFGGFGVAAAGDSGTGGAGGSATAGDIRIIGGDGGPGSASGSSPVFAGGTGGVSYWGGGGGGNTMGNSANRGGRAGRAYGSGGGGAASTNSTGAAGGVGAAGVVIVEEFY